MFEFYHCVICIVSVNNAGDVLKISVAPCSVMHFTINVIATD